MTDAAPADLSNWREPPHSAWAFRNVPVILPTAAIASAQAPRPLPASRSTLADFHLPRPDGAALGVDAVFARTAGDALVVLKDGAVIHEAYAHGNDAQTPHILMSATKSVTGLLAGILAAAGELDLSAPIETCVPEVAGGPFAGATLQQLLDMRTGVKLSPEDERVYAAACGWDPPLAEAPGRGLHAFLAALRTPGGPHGGPFAYVSANTDLMGWAIERAAGRGLADLLSARLWRPMGAEHAAYITLDPQGAPRPTGGMGATARDLARLGQALIEGGVTPAGWFDDLQTGGDREAWARGEFAAGFRGAMSYRNGWYVVHDEPAHVFAMGIHGQNLFVDRERRVVIARLSSQGPRTDYAALILTHTFVPALLRFLA